MKPKIFVALLCGVFLAYATPALANSPTQSTYGGPGANQVSKLPATSAARTLPFTGIDLSALSLVGVGLLGAGVVLRRRTSHSTD